MMQRQLKKGLIKTLNSSIFDVVTGLTLSGAAGTVNPIPVGTILPHARAFTNSVPDGFLLANGRTLSQAEYPDLFSVIDTISIV